MAGVFSAKNPRIRAGKMKASEKLIHPFAGAIIFKLGAVFEF